ncbi:MAG: hypothetical protein ABIH46_08385 [Chloroflexota bacterium]
MLVVPMIKATSMQAVLVQGYLVDQGEYDAFQGWKAQQEEEL